MVNSRASPAKNRPALLDNHRSQHAGTRCHRAAGQHNQHQDDVAVFPFPFCFFFFFLWPSHLVRLSITHSRPIVEAATRPASKRVVGQSVATVSPRQLGQRRDRSDHAQER